MKVLPDESTIFSFDFEAEPFESEWRRGDVVALEGKIGDELICVIFDASIFYAIDKTYKVTVKIQEAE